MVRKTRRAPPLSRRRSVRETSQAYGSYAGAVLVDSGPLIALFNKADRWHGLVIGWLKVHERARLHTTWPVATEVCALLARRVRNDAALDFLRWAQKGGVSLDSAAEASLA